MTAKRPTTESGFVKAKGVHARPSCALTFMQIFLKAPCLYLSLPPLMYAWGLEVPYTLHPLPTRIHSLNSLPGEWLNKPLISIKTVHEWQVAARSGAGTFSTLSR